MARKRGKRGKKRPRRRARRRSKAPGLLARTALTTLSIIIGGSVVAVGAYYFKRNRDISYIKKQTGGQVPAAGQAVDIASKAA